MHKFSASARGPCDTTGLLKPGVAENAVLLRPGTIAMHGYAGLRTQRDLLSSCDYVFFGGGGLVERGTGVHTPLFEGLRPPFACLGISVEAVHDDNAALLRVLHEKSSFILVRDQNSAKAFGPSNKVVVGPDLTFLYPYAPSGLKNCDSDVCGLNLLPWDFWPFQYKGTADRFLRHFTKKFPTIEKLYPFPKWNPARAVEVVRQEFSTVMPLPFYREPGQPSDGEVLCRFFSRVEDTFSPETLSGCGAIIAMRLHAAIFACQMGIPFVSFDYQPKNRWFCRTIGHESYCVSLFRPAELKQAITKLKVNHKTVRKHLISVRNQGEEQIHRLVKDLLGPLLN